MPGVELLIGVPYRLISCTNSNRTIEIRWVGAQALYEDKVYGFEIDGVRSCWRVDFLSEDSYPNPSDALAALPVYQETFNEAGYDTCEECQKLFYKLIDCETGEFIQDLGDPSGDILIDDDSFIPYANKTIKISLKPYGSLDEPVEYCATVYPVIALGLRTLEHEYTVHGCYRTCEVCQAPEPVEGTEPEFVIKKKNYEPNFGLPVCSLEEYTRIHSQFSESMYKQMVEAKYGLEICNEIDEERYLIKKALLDLEIIKNSFDCCDDNGLWDPCVEDGGIGFMTINGNDCNPFTIHPAT